MKDNKSLKHVQLVVICIVVGIVSMLGSNNKYIHTAMIGFVVLSIILIAGFILAVNFLPSLKGRYKMVSHQEYEAWKNKNR